MKIKSMSQPKVYLVGGHVTPFVGKGNPDFKQGSKTLADYMQEAVQGALRNTVNHQTRQGRARHDTTRHDTTRQARQDKTRPDQTRQDKTRQVKTRQDKVR